MNVLSIHITVDPSLSEWDCKTEILPDTEATFSVLFLTGRHLSELQSVNTPLKSSVLSGTAFWRDNLNRTTVLVHTTAPAGMFSSSGRNFAHAE